jgi:5'-3' exonuclease
MTIKVFMGIKGLTKFIQECGVIVPYSDYKNKYVVVDVFQKIYRYCTNKNNIMNVPTNENDDTRFIYNKHLRAILNSVKHFNKFQTHPIYVFDGLSIAIKVKNKKDAKNKRLSESSDTQSQLSGTVDDKKEMKKVFKISPLQIKDCEILLNLLGIPNIRAPHEADSQCAAFTICNNSKIVSTVMTDDTDVLVFGATSILRMLPLTIVNTLRQLFKRFIETHPQTNRKYSISDILNVLHEDLIQCGLDKKICMSYQYNLETIVQFSDRTNINFAIKYDSKNVCEYLLTKANKILLENILCKIDKFTMNNFIDMCIIFGTDYSPRICDMYVEEIFRMFVLANLNVNKLVEELRQKNILVCDDYLDKYTSVKEYYKNASVIDPRTVDLQLYKQNKEELYNFLRKNGFSQSYATNCIG